MSQAISGGTMAVRSLLLCAVMVVVATDVTAQAQGNQPPDSVVLLPELTVPIGRLRVGAVPAASAPFPIQTIQLRGGSSDGLARSMSALPGVTLGNQTGSPYQSDIRIRGFAVSPVVGVPQSVSVFVDGVRVNEADASQVHMSLVPMAAVERIEVIRGPAGAFGKNALAGSINIVTARGNGDPFVELEGETGSYGTGAGTLRFGGRGDAWDHLVVADYRKSDGWRDLSYSEERSVFGKLGWRGDRTDAWLSVNVQSDSIGGPGPIPESWIEGEELPPGLVNRPADLRRLQYTGGKGDAFRSKLLFLNGHLDRELNDRWSLQLTAFHRAVDFRQGNDNITEPDALGITDIGSWGTTAQLAYQPDESLVAILGSEVVRNRVDIDIRELPNAAFPAIVPATTELLQTIEYNAGAFTELWWSVRPRLTLLSSLRFDYAHLPVTDLLDPADSGENTFYELTGGLGLSWEMTPLVSGFGGYNRGFRSPVILEVSCADPADPCQLPFELGPDPPLLPVVSNTWQAGLRLGTDRVRGELVGYWSDVRDDIVNVVDPVTPTQGWFVNLDRTRRVGSELQVDVAAGRGLSLTGALALSRATYQSSATLSAPFLDDDDDDPMPPGPPTPPDDDDDLEPPEVEPGDRFPMVPAVSFTVGARYTVGPTTFELTGRRVTQQHLIGDENNEAPFPKLEGYGVVDLRVEQALERWSVFAEMTNVLDAEYAPFGIISGNVRGADEEVERFLTPGLPRSITMGARVRMGL